MNIDENPIDSVVEMKAPDQVDLDTSMTSDNGLNKSADSTLSEG